ncbi:MAG: methylated-DNA--[protein]-cysteine S-methyltransferase [Clostridia bacterium]|nr:methylated-DNA--[protein]-cysteine S-methyltransferase [Clostridia bacterium]MDD4375585.1 methylated-DNA--[protein]-cysteine S-methyltransferase [Clostridia bacterium]
MRSYYSYNTPIGYLTIIEDKNCITNIEFGLNSNIDGKKEETHNILMVEKQLNEYFNGSRFSFNLPLRPTGTEFQNKVWNVLIKIPYGETRSYKEIAIEVGSPKASRAVGMACNKNPIAVVIACHRVLGINKKLVGYAGGLDKKDFLLTLEKRNKPIC